MNTAISDSVMETIVKPISLEPLSAACIGRQALLEMAHDVLDHDHRVVDHETDGDRQRHQRQIVEAVAEHIQHREGPDQRQRNRDRGNDGGPEISQEQEDDHHHQRDRQHQRELDVGDGGADGLGAVGGDRHLDRGRDGRLQLGQQRLDPIDGLDDVGAGNALNREDDGRLLAVPAGEQVVFRRLDRRSRCRVSAPASRCDRR